MQPETEDPTADPVRRVRDRFLADRRAFIQSHGPEAFDQAQVLYVCARTGKRVVLRDAFYGPQPAGPVDAFVGRLRDGWWRSRQTFAGQAEPGVDLKPVAGFYGRYLGEVGFDWIVEFDAEAGGATHAWRVDARGRAWRLDLPTDEGMFRDQTGTFFDLRAGWRWVVDRHRPSGQLVVAEVQPGYVVGARVGVPGDPEPAARPDPALEDAFSARTRADFDVLEFLGGPAAEALPFHGERYGEWLGDAAAEVDAGRLELFVLADSSNFLAGIEDLCARRGIAVEWVTPDEDLKVALHHGPLRLELNFSYPFLRTLHTGRSFVEGTRAFYLPVVDALDDALDLLRAVEKHVRGHRVHVEDGVVLVIDSPDDGPAIGRWNLMTLVGRQPFRGAEGEADLLRLLGYDPEAARFLPRPDALDICPVTGAPARVNKVVRPVDLLGVDPRTLVGVAIGPHFVYYTLDSATHSTPVEPGPGKAVTDLEAAYRARLDEASTSLLEARPLDEDDDAPILLVGFDVGSLVLEPARVRALLDAVECPIGGAAFAYAFFADTLVVSPSQLSGRALYQARLAALEAAQPRFPARLWALDLARALDLDVEPLGRAERPA